MSPSLRATYSEHDGEPVPGLPAPLPEGETVLWQGAPGWRGLARRAMHLRGLAIYFAILAAWRAALIAHDGGGALAAAEGAAFLLLIGAVPIGLLALYAWLTARGTLYTITTRRVVVRTGVALPMTVNIPFAVIGAAAVARHADGTGDIVLQLMPPHRVSWLALWPHTRSFRVIRPEPTLRAVAQPDAVAQVLSRALAASAAMPVRATRPETTPSVTRPAGTAEAAA